MRSVQRIAFVLGSGILVAALGTTVAQGQTPRGQSAYVVLEFNVKDPEGFKDYAQRAPATVAQYGGKFLVRPGKIVSLAGDAPKGAFAVLAFETAEQAEKWARSPEYTALVPMRDKSSDARVFIVEGVAP
jgi:uncharacterized protein (DUF1330 family)